MAKRSEGSGVFVSCVSSEFENAGAPFPGLRSDLRHYLSATHCQMFVQEDFPQTAEDTVDFELRLVSRRLSESSWTWTPDPSSHWASAPEQGSKHRSVP